MFLLIDNYDSFAHNLARYLRRLGCNVRVIRNDELRIEEIERLKGVQGIVISPGPCTPQEAGCSIEVIQRLGPHVPILGVCLGHQAIATAFGAAVVRAAEPRHGRSSAITHNGLGLFADLSNPMIVGRYHSLVVDASTLPTEFEITAQDDQGVLMAFAHRRLPLFGVQFHPESILTTQGYALLANFVRLCGLNVESVDKLQEGEYVPIAVAIQELPARPVTF